MTPAKPAFLTTNQTRAENPCSDRIESFPGRERAEDVLNAAAATKVRTKQKAPPRFADEQPPTTYSFQIAILGSS
jgi:hypothetical protein